MSTYIAVLLLLVLLMAGEHFAQGANCAYAGDLDLEGTYLCFESAATGTMYIDEKGDVLTFLEATETKDVEPVVWYESSNLTVPRGSIEGSITSNFGNVGTWAYINITRGVDVSAISPQPGHAFLMTSGNFEVSGELDNAQISSQIPEQIQNFNLNDLAEEYGVVTPPVVVSTYATVPTMNRAANETCLISYGVNEGTCLNFFAQGNPYTVRFGGYIPSEPCDVDFIMLETYNIGGPSVDTTQSFAEQVRKFLFARQFCAHIIRH